MLTEDEVESHVRELCTIWSQVQSLTDRANGNRRALLEHAMSQKGVDECDSGSSVPNAVAFIMGDQLLRIDDTSFSVTKFYAPHKPE